MDMFKNGIYYSSDKINYKYFLKDNLSKKANYNDYCILSLITKEASRKISSETKDSNQVSPFDFDYDINDIKKLDESNISLSDISDLDLDADEEKLKNKEDSFNSCDDDINQSEEEEIKIISKKRIKRKNQNEYHDLEFDEQLDNDLIEIRKELENRRRFSVQVDYFKKMDYKV